MMLTIPNHKNGYQIVSLAKDEETKAYLCEKQLACLFLAGETVTFYPEGITISLDKSTAEKLASQCNLDIFEINDNGAAYLCFSNTSTDNAIAVTNRCNSNCIMCPSSETARRLGSTAQIENLLEIVRHIPTTAAHLTITGGEPFLIGEDMFVLLQAIKEKFRRTDILLLTNGRAFASKRFCALLEQSLPKHTVIGIPLHGYDPQSHDSITGVPGSFAQTFAGLQNILEKRLHVELRIVVSRLSAEWLDQIATLICASLSSVYCVKIIGLEMLGSAAVHREMVWISYRAAFLKAKEAITRLIMSGIDVGLYNFPLCAVDREFWHICDKSISDYKVRFADCCERCMVKDACGGIFAGTYRLAKDDLTPIAGV